MKYSDVEICNIALATVGSDAIDDLGVNHKKNRMCSAFYSFTRDYLLTSFDWSFARKFQMLVASDLDASMIPPGMCAYELPADLEIVRSLYPFREREKWEIFGDKLFTPREENAGVYYTRADITSYEFSTAFSNLLAIGIAVRLAASIVQDEALAATLYAQYMQDMNNCMAIDANANNNYRSYDETPENDTFVRPDLAGYMGLPVDGYS